MLRKPIRGFLSEVSELGFGKAFARKGLPLTQQTEKPADEVLRAVEPETARLAAPVLKPSKPRIVLGPAGLAVRANIVSNIEHYTPEDQIERLADALALMTLHLGFEQTYRQIFGSQLTLLRRAAAGPVSFDDARAIYDESPISKQTPPFAFARWLSFLTDYATLLEKRPDADVLELTIHGREFLAYLAQNGIEQHPRPF